MDYVKKYDPGYFSFVFAFKACISLVISCTAAYYIFDNRVPAILAAFGGLYVFFLIFTLSPASPRKSYILFFIVVSTICAALFTFLAQDALTGKLYDILWLVIPIIALSFIVGMSSAYSMELYRVMASVMMVALVACLYVEAKVPLTTEQIVVSMPLGALVAMFFTFFSFTPHKIYGRYIRTHYPLILNHCMLMVKNIQDQNIYRNERQEALALISTLKRVLQSKTGYLKNPYAIKNLQRAVFYIYRIEDLTLSINNLHEYTSKEGLNPKLKKELMYNLMQLSDIFAGHIPKIESKELDIFLKEKATKYNPVQIDALKILYLKIKIFSKPFNATGSTQDGGIAPFNVLKAFKVSFKSIGWRNEVYRFSVKYSLAVTIPLVIATTFDLYRGIWMCFGVVATIRPSVGGLQSSGKDYIVGNVLGAVIGIVVAYFTHDTAFFYIFLALSVFFMIYSRVYPSWLATANLVFALVLFYSLIYYHDYLEFVLQRFIDVITGFVIAIAVFWAIWPRYSYNTLFAQFKKQINELESMTTLLQDGITKGSIDCSLLQNKQSEFLDRNKEIRSIIKESKHEKRFFWIVQESENVMSVLDSILMHINELTNFLSTSMKEGKDVHLCINDLNVIKFRFDMIHNLMTSTPHYFKYDANDKLLIVDDKYFSWMIKSIFDSQDELYTIASRYMNKIDR
ncbi:FUSC family protein [Helicobacter sp. 13S00401-1]|uniref:FUSC family protein n=1 Tax=Helicobacter sp. 13S00401-1 TaxID=1905758 RepID=UPI0015537D85|nr:FUSC family protein [Helicobacter sp. 13S00401-1]